MSDRWTGDELSIEELEKNNHDTQPESCHHAMSMQAHPFHLHGQSFRVLRVGGQALSTPLIKDTVDVPAMMGTVDLEFVAFNPGDWMFHCHKPMHMDGGMATLVKIG